MQCSANWHHSSFALRICLLASLIAAGCDSNFTPRGQLNPTDDAGSGDGPRDRDQRVSAESGPRSSFAYFCPPSGSCWENPFPQGNTLLSAWGESANDVTFFGRAGTALHFDGQGWQIQPISTTSNLNATWADGTGTLVAVGSGGTVMFRDESGWHRMDQDLTDQSLVSVWGTSTDNLYVAGQQGDLLHYNGQTWTLQPLPGSPGFLRGIWGSGPDDVFVVGEGAHHFDGQSWSAMTAPAEHRLLSIWGTGPGEVFAGSWGGELLRFDGAQWAAVPLDLDFNDELNALWGSGPDNLFGASFGAMLHFDGAVWQKTEFPDNPRFYGVFGPSPGDVYGFGVCGRIHRFDGTGWSEISRGTDATIRTIWVAPDGEAFASGDEGTLLQRQGERWEKMDLSGLTEAEAECQREDRVLCADLRGIWGTASDNIYVVGGDMRILHYDGKGWSRLSHDIGKPYNALIGIWGFSDDDIYACGQYGVIMHFDGQQWSAMESGTEAILDALWGTSPDNLYAAGQSGTILHYDGQAWSSMETGESHFVNALWGSGADDIFAVGRGFILHYDGLSWETMELPGADLELQAVWGSGPRDVYAAGLYGLVLHYDGTRWSRMLAGTGMELFAAGGRDQDVFVGGSCGAIIHRGAD